MRESLLRHLWSPCCKAPLSLKGEKNEGDEILEGDLACDGCRRSYRITQGVPRFVKPDAYVDAFSFEWQIHRRTQYTSADNQASRTDFGRKIEMPLTGLEGKLVLDAGCGTGRYGDVLKDSGAEIICVDYSYAVDVARENLSGRPNVHFIQADIFELPLRNDLFDYIYSVGVLHHTPDTRKAFDALVRKLAPGGRISIYVYPSYDRVFRLITNFYRKFTTHLPKRLLYQLCKVAIPLHYVQKIPVLGPIICNLIPSGSIYEDPQWRVLNTFDWYSPKYQWAHTVEEVFAWFEEAGLESIRVLPYGVTLAGTKPGSPRA